MSTNLISSVHGTPGDAASGLTLVEQYLEKAYAKARTYMTPLVQAAFFSKKNLPRKAGQYVKMTRLGKLRGPEVASDATDPESGAVLSYEQFTVPVEYINDYVAIGTIAQDTSWIDLAKDAKDAIEESLRRYLNTSAQAAMLGGRFQPGHRNSSGVTTGAGSYPHFWTTPQATPTLYGATFSFPAAPRYFANGRTAYADLQAADRITMADFKRIRTRMKNAGAPTINGMYVAVISEAIAEDLKADDKWFQHAIRDQRLSQDLIKGVITDYAGFHWVIDDEPWTLTRGGDQYARQVAGDVHVAQVFGQDCFASMRLGGKDAARPTFKVQDISITGNKTTIGYLVPHQNYVLQRAWGANVIAPVSEPGSNG